ncbi:MAG: LapA family protein [Oscillatoria sp. PMC 1068.18]|nr:LapA family protein [Oscillatoria sp. PMC 1076.18]MEC4991376.1 LapA family protein [Oscillatoria sp. PMC 1068.18]
MLRLLLISGLLIAFLAIVFALQNASFIAVNFLLWRFQGSLALILLLTLALGVIAGILVCSPIVIKRNWKIASVKKKIKEMERVLEDKNEAILKQDKRIQYLEESLQLQSSNPNYGQTQIQE